MRIAWFFEMTGFAEDITSFRQEVIDQGYEVIQEKYVPFQGGEYTEVFKGYDLVIFYGSLNMASQLRSENHPNLVIYSTAENYECTKYYAYLGPLLLNNDYTMLPYSELKRQKDRLYEIYGRAEQIFVRPSSGEKIFTGQLVNQKTFDKDYELLGFYDVLPHHMVVVSTPKDIVKEWRFVIAGGVIVTGSLYHDTTMNCDYNGYSDEASGLVDKVLEIGYEPDRAWTIDVCMTRDGKHHLLEIGGFSCAGMYEGNIHDIVERITNLAISDRKAFLQR